MTGGADRTVTTLLLEWRDGDGEALDRLIPLVYDELRRIARSHMSGERGGHTLQTTALVHEAYRRLIDADVSWNDRVHFFSVVARVMRRVLVDHARGVKRDKRGGDRVRVTLDEDARVTTDRSEELLTLDRALSKLAGFDERKARAVELHYFGGMTYEEAAAAMELSPTTFHVQLKLARAWLQREMAGRDGS